MLGNRNNLNFNNNKFVNREPKRALKYTPEIVCFYDIVINIGTTRIKFKTSFSDK